MTRNQLIIFYLPLYRKVASLYRKNMPKKAATHLSENDLVSAIVLKAPGDIARFDPEKKVKPGTYLGNRARFNIIDYVRQIDWVPRSARSSGEEAKEQVSLDGMTSKYSHGPDGSFGASRAMVPLVLGVDADGFESIDATDEIAFILQRLSGKERLALRFYFIHGKTMKQTGALLCLAESRVSQMISGALKYLRETTTEEQRETWGHLS
jgi:RNA polymerase sigma factor for flagellar operon FliA